MRVALVHDDLVQWGGAERILSALTEIFPDAPIFTSLYDYDNELLKRNFASEKVITSFLQKVPFWKTLYHCLLPFYPLAFELFDFSQFDVVISQSTRFSHCIITKPSTFHICYCHTPARFLWNLSKLKINQILNNYLSWLRIYDRISASRVDLWLAGSENAQKRISKFYRQESSLLYPFVDTNMLFSEQTFEGDYFLVVSRLNSYKRVDIAVKLATEQRLRLKVVGKGPQQEKLMKIAGPNVEFLQQVDDYLLVKLLAGCKALIICAEEDFGLTAIEAQALGKPVIAYGRGGVMETVINQKTGYFFDEQTTGSLKTALDKLEVSGYNKEICIKQAAKFSKEIFVNKIKNFVFQGVN